MVQLPYYLRAPFARPTTALSINVDALDEVIPTLPGLTVFMDATPGHTLPRSDGVQGYQRLNRAVPDTWLTSPDTSSTPISPAQTVDSAGVSCLRYTSTTQQNGIVIPGAITDLDKWTVFWCTHLKSSAETQCFWSAPNGTATTINVLRLQVPSNGFLTQIDHNGGTTATLYTENDHQWDDSIVFGIFSNGPAGVRVRHNKFLSADVGTQYTLETGDVCWAALAGFGASGSGLSHNADDYFCGILDGVDLNEAANATFLNDLMTAAQARTGFVTTTS